MKKPSWVEYAHQRIKKNKNFIVTLTGPTGSGKSWTGLSIAEQLDSDFDATRVIFSATELMNLINSGKLKRGSVILWDEAGVDLSNRNWQSMTNKLINLLVQTFRHKGFILIFTVPYSDFVDMATRKLFHANFETQSINTQRKTCRIKPLLLEYNPEVKKWYRHYLKKRLPGGGMSKVRRWDVVKPSEELIKEYEKKKIRFTRELNEDIEFQLQMHNQNKERKELTDNQKNIISEWEKGVFIGKVIAENIGIDPSEVSRNIKRMRNKGYFQEKYKELNKIESNAHQIS